MKRAFSVWPVLSMLCVSCGPAAKDGTAPKTENGPPATMVTLQKPIDVPPAAASATPIAFKQFEPAGDLPARRPLVPMPTAIALKSASKTGTVDETGDETPLSEILIGVAVPAAEKDKPIETDIATVKNDVHLVLDTPYQIFSKVGTYVHVAAYLDKFAPASGARVYVDGKLKGRCDVNGAFVFRDVPDTKGGGYGGSHPIVVVAGTGAGRSKGGATYSAYGRTHSFERANLYVYTDRGVFSPGETIHVRAFAWRLRGDYRPFNDAPVNVLLRKDGKVLSGGRVMTDKMGVAWLDMPLPSTTPEGPYELAVEHLGERSTARLQVKRMVAPVVKIDHTLPRFLTRDANDLAFEVTLASATGERFATGSVTIKGLDPKGVAVFTETRAVTGGGPHKFSIDQESVKKLRDGFADDQTAAVIIEVTDGSTGRKDELRRDLRISRAPYRLVVETDRNEHVTGETVKVVVHATDLEQAPAIGHEVEIKVNMGGGPGTEKTFTSKTDGDGLAKATFTMPAAWVNIDASLVKAKTVHGYGYVSNSPPRAMFGDVAAPVVTERAKTPIEVKFPSNYVPSEKVVHADVVDSSGALIHSFLVPITKEHGEWVAKGTFPAPSWGSMLITLFAIGVDKTKVGDPNAIGLLTDGANLPVTASRPISVTLKAPASALPGETVTVDVSLKGPELDKAKSDPRPMALGASISEDAFLALLDPLEHTPTQVLYNPERKVMATTGSQILTWPVVQKTWGTWNYDIALPPFGFRPGGLPMKMKGGGYAAGDDLDSLGYGGLGGTGSGSGYSAGGGSYKSKSADVGGSKAPMPSPTATAKPSAAAPPPPPTSPKPDAKKMAKDEAYLPAGTEAAPKEAEKKGEKHHGKGGHEEVAITIRTDFSPTSLWLPEMILPAPGSGKEHPLAHFLAKLPDSITTQRVTVVATDDRGAIGIGRATIKVDQDLSVRSDLPAVLTQGDEVEVGVAVRNARKEAATGTVSLVSTGIAILGTASSPITVAANSSSAVKFRVKAQAAGSVPFTVSFVESRPIDSKVTGPLRDDREERKLWVTPKGAPIEARVDSTLVGGKAFAFEVDRSKDDVHVEADLSIAFPSAVPLIEGLEELADDSYMGVDPDASRLLATIALEGYMIRTHAPVSSIARIHERLQLATTSLLLQQQPDGGWGWRWDTWAATQGLGSGSSPYATTHALQALAKIRDTDIPVPDLAISQGRSYLLNNLDQDGEVDVSNVAFWEGDGASKKRAATMAAFQAIAATERGHKLYGHEMTKMDALVKKAEAIAKGGPGAEDPLTLSSAVLGLHLHAKAAGKAALERDTILQGTQALLASYRGGYWEPSWFHAWGGRIEATRGVIELLSTVAPGVYDADLHDAVSFVLATRPSWGAWHNAWGTAAAIEALTFLDPTPPEKAGATVAISVDQKLVRTVKIDADDPFVSAASLRSVDLSSYLSVGKHEVRIAYDGSLSVPASVTLKRWNAATKVEGLGVKIDRALSAETIPVGGTTSASIKITSAAAHAEMVVKIPLGPGLSVDARAMEALVRAGTIAGFRAEGSLVLDLHKVAAGTTELKLPLVATRRGSFALAPVSAFVPRSSAEGWSGEGKVTVK